MTRSEHLVRAVSALALLAPAAAAQFDNQWATFAQDSTRLRDSNGDPASYIAGDTQEKDFAYGDLDQDGWIDLVVMRKQPVETTGAFPNYLLMNEGGLLVDRSAQYASASDVPGDLGFLTPTNDRDAVICDVNLDGWLDVITAATLSEGQPKHISHPRIYLNQGNDVFGHWQGVRFENFRIPEMSPTPRFSAVDAGDVTGDGAPDLYFADHGNLGDRLLINDGNGVFTDSGVTRLSLNMLNGSFSVSVDLVDMNLDGLKDIVRDSGLLTGSGSGPHVSIAYNDPTNVGYFPVALFQNNVASSNPYHSDVGDLNNDNRPDVISTDDGADNYRFNVGNDAQGKVVWGPLKFYQFLTGSDHEFGGTCLIVDIDGDGWKDAIHSDVDATVAGCSHRAHVYHNLGGAPGDQVTLREESQTAGGGWRGVVGLLPTDATGTFDIAVFDLDNDGDNDIVFGRCSGTFVWLNQKYDCPVSAYSFGDQLPNSTGLVGRLAMGGESSLSANNMQLLGSDLPSDATGLFLYGTTRLWTPVPFGNGLRFVGGSLLRLHVITSDASGGVTFSADLAAAPLNALSAGDVRDFQLWFRDPAAGGALFNASEALEIRFCP